MTNNGNTNLAGKTILVTGATGGIGRITAETLAGMGANVVIVGRNATKVRNTVDEIRQKTGNAGIEGMVADLSVQSEVRRLAEEYKAAHDRLDVLVNNAGGVFTSRQESKDGIEMTFALNHLNYFLLTNLLLDTLRASAPARIVSVSSMAHSGGHINFDDLEGKHGYSGWGAYSQSKLANILFTYELARRLEGTGVTANCLHPGFVATNFGRSNGGIMNPIFGLAQIFAISPEKGAETSIYLASSPEVEGVSGKYFDKKKSVRSNTESYDRAIAERLWQVSLEMTGLTEPVHSA